MSGSSASLFQQEKHCTCAGEPHQFTCAPTGIPANCFLQLCTNHFFSIPYPKFQACDTCFIYACRHTCVCVYACIQVYRHTYRYLYADLFLQYVIMHLHKYICSCMLDMYECTYIHVCLHTYICHRCRNWDMEDM